MSQFLRQFLSFRTATAEGNRIRRQGIGIWVMLIAWAAVTMLGMAYLANYEFQAGPSIDAPTAWPSDSALVRSPERPTLLFFAHPKCPCTRAAVGELARLMVACQGRLDAHAIFVQPPAADEVDSWTSTHLWQLAEEIPGVQVRLDQLGREAQRFRAATSGQVYLFDRSGILRFEGGITSSRGHSGDNAGRRAIIDWIEQGTSEVNRTPVFGCELGTHQGAELCCQR